MSELYCKIVIVSVLEDCLRSFGDRNLPCSVHCIATLRRLIATKVGRLVVRPMAPGGSLSFLCYRAIEVIFIHVFIYLLLQSDCLANL